ncbi:Di-copper centre-containing protein [Aulographum hederae CBS 113979]|uniref:tyrosinase n=1 Tax=Aulographum hederae CBS 113979 TaxID=1176131 RepID=A0A6G1GZN1_9PEZI|nr:Di-copper centre-containing protein [Aulographum hederae CBS 113979]
MGFLSYLGAFSAALLVVNAAPFPLSSDNVPRQVSTIPITGVKGSGVQVRREIGELSTDPVAWDIFILGLNRFMSMDPKDPMSYHQLAGIHGSTFGDWDGVGKCATCSSGSIYCTHGNTLFPTWHRPYLAAFEQSLQINALAVANEFTGADKAKYVEAAQNLRLPYWDWATEPSVGTQVFPDYFDNQNVTVRTGNGTQVVHNPLWAYKFPNEPTLPAPWNTPQTRRSSRSQNQEEMGFMLSGLKSTVYQLFSQEQNYNNFSTTMFQGGGAGSYNSIENPHNTIHSVIGGSGHLSSVPVAGFDPLFWLHHCNVDRQFALWQAINPTAEFTTVTELTGSWTFPANTVVDKDFPLSPFHTGSAGEDHTSANSWDWRVLGYTYPELTEGFTIESVKTAINKLYAPPTTVPEARRRNVAAIEARATANATSNTYNEYSINLKAPLNAVGGTFGVFVFDGSVPSTPATTVSRALIKSSTFMGFHSFLSNALTSSDSSALVTGTIPITQHLLRDVAEGELASMEPADVEAYLRGKLQWTVVKRDGTVVPAEDVEGLVVSVATAVVERAGSDAELPRWGVARVLVGATEEKVNGLRRVTQV